MHKDNDKIDHINYALVAKTHSSMYLMHKYWARKPHNVVAEYIKHYSKEGDIVLDPFCGSGVTVIEALKSGRKAVGIDLDPAAIFITRCTVMPVDLEKMNNAFKDIEDAVKERIEKLYQTKCPHCKNETTAEAIIWEEDNPIEIRYSCSCNNHNKNVWKNADEYDLKLLQEIKKETISYWYPKNELIWNTRINVHKGLKVSDLFTKRNLLALSAILSEIEKIKNKDIKGIMKFTFSSALSQASKLVFIIRKRGRQKGNDKETKEVGSWATRGYWIPREYFEINAWNCFEERFKKVLRGKQESNKKIKKFNIANNFEDLNNHSNFLIKKYNVLELNDIILPNSVDYIFTDPPYGDAVPYLELDYMWNSWLKFEVDFEDEIIVSDSPIRNKTIELYEKMLNAAFKQIYTVLKPGKYLTLTFHSTNIKIWTAIIKAVIIAGFSLEKIIYQPPARASAKGLLAPYGSAVGDYYIRFIKPTVESKKSNDEISKERYERIVVECAKRILAERGEPTIYQHILNGIIVELKNAGSLLSGDINPDDVMKNHIGDEFTLVDVLDENGKKVGQKWWLENPESIPYLELVPLTDRIETAILNVLHGKIKVSFDDILQEIFIKFPNALTPDTQNIKEILSEYAEKTRDGKWILKAIVSSRETQHSEMIYYLAVLGKKAGFDIWIGQREQGDLYKNKKLSNLCTTMDPVFRFIPTHNIDRVKQIDVLWYRESRINYEFEVENTTVITEAIIRGSNIPTEMVKRYIVIPDERERFLYKKAREPILKENVEKNNWKFITYKDLQNLFIESKRKKEIDTVEIDKIAKIAKKIEPSKQLDMKDILEKE
jgi:DNA modification methylase/Zn ribbon nucleic-acid-binding protein